MASRRDLKKDIDYLLFEVIADCFLYADSHPDNKTEEITNLITEVVQFRNDLIARVNNPDGKDNPKIVKAFYQSISKDLLEGADKYFEKLSSISSKKK